MSYPLARTGLLRSLLPWLLTCWGLVAYAIPALADTGALVRFPQPPDKPEHGLTLTVDTRWIDGSGYRPVKFTVATSNGKPAISDRKLRVSFRPRTFYYRATLPEVSQTIVLPEGKASATNTMLVPQTCLWNAFSLKTVEDGNLYEELSTENMSSMTIWSNSWTEALPATIVFHRHAPLPDDRSNWVSRQVTQKEKQIDDFPDLRILLYEHAFATSVDLRSVMTARYHAISVLNQLPRTDVLPHTAVPDNWLALSSADLIVLEWQDLEDLAQTHPLKLQALSHWLNAGGNLLIYQAGAKGTAQVDQLLDLPTEHEHDNWTSIASAAAAKFATRAMEDLRRGQYAYQMSVGAQNVGGVMIHEGNITDQGNASNQQEPDTWNLALREVGFGKLALLDEDPFPGDSHSWRAILGAIGDRTAWFQRHGMSRVRDNTGFWDFLIPGVGMAPVTGFEILITLFVIVIGPVNYFLLRAIGRLNLLIITVPVGAFVVTGVLMTYALVSDGLGTQTRIRSMTILDQRKGTGATWSRQAYYSGLAASGGLVYPADAAVYEYEQSPLLENLGTKHLTWNDAQVLRGGYFRSRVTHQYLVIRPFETQRRLDIHEQDGSLQIENHLGTKIRFVHLTDSQGESYVAEELADDGSTVVSKADSEAVLRLRNLLGEADMELPPGFDRSTYLQRSTTQRNRYYLNTNLLEQYRTEPSFSTSLLEQTLRESKAESFGALKPNTYFAVVERFPESKLGTDAPLGPMSLEVIRGTW